MTQEEILQKGIRAAEVLNSDIMEFINDLQALQLEAISNTQPHEAKTRESLYFQYKGIRDLIDGLHQYVQAGQAIAKTQDATSDEGDEE